MKLSQLPGYGEAVDAIRAHTSPRYEEINKLEQYTLSTQYAGRDGFWTDKKPLWERAPCIAYPIVASAIRSNVDLVLGEGRFPTLSTRQENRGETDEKAAAKDDSQKLDLLLLEIVKQTRFRAHGREVLAHAQGCRSGVALYGIRNGKLFA